MVAVCAAGLALLIWFLSTTSDTSALTDVSAGRPIMMLIVILTPVVFGGMMLNAALFGSASDDAAESFQRGREVFLVFSGICATVVGFYFGSGRSTPRGLPSLAPRCAGSDGTITATVTGRAAAHRGLAQGRGRLLPFAAVADDGSKFTLTADQTVCPADGNYQVTGSTAGGYPPLAVTFSSDELANANWSACGAGDGDADAAEEPAADQAQETPAPSPSE